MSTMPEHVCSCRHCDPDLYPSGGREGPHHFSVRFGDRHITAFRGDQPLVDCYEAFCGPQGRALVYATPDGVPHARATRCGRCGRNACLTWIEGDIRVSLTREIGGRVSA